MKTKPKQAYHCHQEIFQGGFERRHRYALSHNGMISLERYVHLTGVREERFFGSDRLVNKELWSDIRHIHWRSGRQRWDEIISTSVDL
jgi:hypothetical protein